VTTGYQEGSFLKFWDGFFSNKKYSTNNLNLRV
jgi:hypothetical protein